MNEALLCIARQKRFVVKELSSGLRVGFEYSVALNDMNSVALRSDPKVWLVAGQTIKVYEWHPDVPDERFRITATSYTYGFTVKDGDSETELLMFQWKRDRDPIDPYPQGHLHIGQGLIGGSSAIRPKDFHKAHVPTDRIPFESIVRFAIVELGVNPLRTNWTDILDASEQAFRDTRTDLR